MRDETPSACQLGLPALALEALAPGQIEQLDGEGRTAVLGRHIRARGRVGGERAPQIGDGEDSRMSRAHGDRNFLWALVEVRHGAARPAPAKHPELPTA